MALELELKDGKGSLGKIDASPLVEEIRKMLPEKSAGSEGIKLAEETASKLKALDDENNKLLERLATLTDELAEARKEVHLAEVSAEERQAFFLEVIPDAEAYVKLGESMGYKEKQEKVAEPVLAEDKVELAEVKPEAAPAAAAPPVVAVPREKVTLPNTGIRV